jgi:DNA repair protein RadC
MKRNRLAVRSEPAPAYSSTEQETIDANYCRLRLAALEHEVFACLFLDTRHRVIAFEELSRGTVDGAEVHPREIVKRALQLNASALIISHNHPSGNLEFSAADLAITIRLKQALALVEVRLLDHILVTAGGSLSGAREGRV